MTKTTAKKTPAKKPAAVPTKATVKALEREAFNAYKKLQTLAFKKGGIGGVLQVGGQALEVAKFAAAKCVQDGGEMDAAQVAVAKSLLKNWMPGIIKSLSENGYIMSLK